MIKSRLFALAVASGSLWLSGCMSLGDRECTSCSGSGGGFLSRFKFASHKHGDCDCHDSVIAGSDGPLLTPPPTFAPSPTFGPPATFAPSPTMVTPGFVPQTSTPAPPRIVPVPQANPMPYSPQ